METEKIEIEDACPECNHSMSRHGAAGCEAERGDGLIGDNVLAQALGPCLCLHTPEKVSLCENCGKPATHTAMGCDTTPTDRGNIWVTYETELCSQCDPPKCSGCRRPASECRCP